MEWSSEVTHLDLVQPGQAVIDVGANVGGFAEQYAERVGQIGEVVAIEPHPSAYSDLVKNATKWPQVHPVNCALSDREGMGTLFWDAETSKRASLWAANILRVPAEGRDRSCEVRVTTLDAVTAELRHPLGMVKVDAQGAEAAILKGATETLNQLVPWFVEVWHDGLEHAGSAVGAVFAPFADRGYIPHYGGSEITWAKALEMAERPRGHAAIDLLMVPPLARNEQDGAEG